MEIYVLNKDFSTAGLCEDYKSVIWNTQYFGMGEFELYLPVTPENIELLKRDSYLVRDKDISDDGANVTYKNVMIIEKFHITRSLEDGDYLTVSGRSLKSLLARRIIWQQTILSGSVENAIRRVVTENAINPSISERKINRLILGQSKSFTQTIDRQVTGDNLAAFVEEVCKTYGIGWDIYIQNESFVFDLYEGTDRSYNQDINPYVEFSQEFDNLLTSEYQYDKTNYRNVALVAGEGEGINRRTATYGDASDIDRYEIYVDSRNSSSNEGEITEDEYQILLIEEGREALNETENSIIENIEGEVEPNGNYLFGVDYFLGDIVEVINEDGIQTTPRIIEIIESEDENGSTTIPTFSTWEV